MTTRSLAIAAHGAIALMLPALLACVSPELEAIPDCPALESVAPLPDSACDIRDLSAVLSDQIVPVAESWLVRVEFDDTARVHSICLDRYGEPSRARRSLYKNLDAILALPPGPECAARRRLDLNRYEAAFAAIDYQSQLCASQGTISQSDYVHGHNVQHSGALQAKGCRQRWAKTIVLQPPDSKDPWVYVKPEIPDPPGANANDTMRRCNHESQVFEEQVVCIESEGWERLLPPPR